MPMPRNCQAMSRLSTSGRTVPRALPSSSVSATNCDERLEVVAQRGLDLRVVGLGDGAKLELHVGGVRFQVVVVVDADRPERLDGVLVVAGDLLPDLEEARPGRPDRREEELLLAGEVTVEAGLGDAGGLGEVGGADAGVALGRKDAAGALDDLAPALLRRESTCPWLHSRSALRVSTH